jgi:SAM-dependent methyltransferase
MEAYPHNVSFIWFAPNHVRAFRREPYMLTGGYDPTRDVLDDQDIMCRMYQLTDFFLVDECLYLQRMHPTNTQRETETNARIQTETVALYDRYVEPNALAWAERRGLQALDLGAAHNKPAGYLGVDRYEGPGVDLVGDVASGIDLPDSSVGVIRAADFLEHVVDKVALFNELYRLLAHGGLLLSLTPSTDGRGAFQDPTHVAFYNENCVAAETPILCSDFQWRPAGLLQTGDEIIAFDESPQPHQSRGERLNLTRLREARVEVNRAVNAACTTVRTNIGPPTTASDGHPWLVLRPGTYPGQDNRLSPVWKWVTTRDLVVGDQIAFFASPWQRDDTREGGWLAGIFDAEGCLSLSNRGSGDASSLSVAQRQSSTLDRIKSALSERGFRCSERRSRGEDRAWCSSLSMLGGRREQMRFLGTIAPPRFMERDLSGLYEGVWVKQGKTVDLATVTALEPAGEREVAGIQTSTGTFITNGYLSHNSFWYYTNRDYARFVPQIQCRFQVSRLVTYFPSEFHQQNNIPYVCANLIAIKEGPRQGGFLLI